MMALSQILPSLFLSGAEGAENAPLVSRTGITLIVNATLCHLSTPLPGVEVLRVPVSDLPSARIDRHFDHVAERIHGNHGGKTLVHCVAGMSRSPALVMAYLMKFRGVSLQQAHAMVRDKRPHIRLNRGFWEQLLSYERRLYGSNSVRLEEEEGPMRVQSSAQPHPVTGYGPMRAQNSAQPRPLTGNGLIRLTVNHGLTTPMSSVAASLTPSLRRAELKDNRKCLSQVPKSPLTRRRGNTVHSGSVAGSRRVLIRK